MNTAQQREAAETLRRLIEQIDQGEVIAPAWYRERLVGAMLATRPRVPHQGDNGASGWRF